MLDRDGFRPNVGIILVNAKKQVFWGKRVREHSWQFPQGGIKYGESPEQAMFRELHEEVGLLPEHVQIVGRTRHWLRYEVPDQWIRREWRGNYRGQKQIWFLLKLVGRDSDICLRATDHPEFDAWRWNDYWIPLETVIEFKQDVYRRAMHELARLLFGRNDPRRLPAGDIWALEMDPQGAVAPQVDRTPSRKERPAGEARSQQKQPGKDQPAAQVQSNAAAGNAINPE